MNNQSEGTGIDGFEEDQMDMYMDDDNKSARSSRSFSAQKTGAQLLHKKS